MRLELRVARTLTGYDCFDPMSVRALSEGHNMSLEEVRLTAIHWGQIAIGATYLLTGTLIPFLTDQPNGGMACLGRCTWSASRSLPDRRLRPNEISYCTG
jgi:hypothetical protein